MNQENKLTTAIIERILGNFGIVGSKNFGKVGLTTKEFYLDKLSLSDQNDNKIFKDLYSAELKIDKDNSILNAMLLNLTDDSIYEFILVFRINSLPIYGLRLIFDNTDVGLFLVKENNKWNNTNMFIKAQVLSGVEYITQQGLSWEPCKEDAELHTALLSLVDF